MNDERYDWLVTCAKNMGSVTVSYDELKDLRTVVRCQDCKYHNRAPCQMRLSLNWTENNDFCSYGERKEGAD